MRGAPDGTAAANSWPPPSSGPEPGPYGGRPAGDPPGPYGSGSQPVGPYGGGSQPVGPYGSGSQPVGPYGSGSEGQHDGGPFAGAPPGSVYAGGPYPGGAYPPPAPGNGFAVASLVCGVVGLVLSLVVIGALPGLLAIGLGIAGLVRARRGSPHRGLAIAGITLGVISLILAIVISVLVGRFLGERLTSYRDCLRLAQTTDQRRACEDQLRRGLQDDTQGITAGGAGQAAGTLSTGRQLLLVPAARP